MRDRGEDPDALLKAYAGMINAAMSDIPADMTITMHLCRGNFRSTFIASGGYEPVAEVMFNQINVHGYFMEFDSERAGGFEPLRFVPKGKLVVLGLVTSKTGTLESKTRSSAASTRRRSLCRSSSSACRRNAALRRARRQYPRRRRTMGEAAHDRGACRRSVGALSIPQRPPQVPPSSPGLTRRSRQASTVPNGPRWPGRARP